MTQKWTKWLICDWWSISCKKEVVHDAFGPSLLIVVNEAASVSVRTPCLFLLRVFKGLQWLQMLWEKRKKLCVAKQKKVNIVTKWCSGTFFILTWSVQVPGVWDFGIPRHVILILSSTWTIFTSQVLAQIQITNHKCAVLLLCLQLLLLFSVSSLRSKSSYLYVHNVLMSNCPK